MKNVLTTVVVATCGLLSTRVAAADDFAFARASTPGIVLYGPSEQIHPLTPEAMAATDLDGNGRDDLVIDFGAPFGVWVYMNQQSWSQLHALSPSEIVAGDLDGNGIGDVVMTFPGYGVWSWNNNREWRQLIALEPRHMATGNIDGLPGDEVVFSFDGLGIWTYASSGTWTPLHPLPATQIVVADLDGGGRSDILLNFAGFGLWAWQNNAGWNQLHPLNPRWFTAGDRDGDGRADVLCDFDTTYGLWMLQNGTSWSSVHPLSADRAIFVDRNLNGRDELFIDFGTSLGTWQWQDNDQWTFWQPGSLAVMVRGRLQAGGTANGIGQPLGTPFTQPSTFQGITMSPLTGNWTAWAPGIIFRGFNYQQPATSASVQYTMGGNGFMFASVDVYSSVVGVLYQFAGYRGNTLVYQVNSSQVSAGSFVTVNNPQASRWIDRLVITLSQPANTTCSTCSNNPMGLSSVVLR